jgi:hypothetical protein
VLVIFGVLLSAVCNNAFVAILRLYYLIPEGAYRTAAVSIHWTTALGHGLTGIGLILATWPFGRRGDRFLWPVGIAVAVLAVVCALPSLVLGVQRWLPTGAPTYWRVVFWWVAPAARESAFLLMVALAGVYLLARVRYRRNRILWLAIALLLALQSLLFASSASQLLSIIDRIKYMTVSGGMIYIAPSGPVLKGVSLAALLGVESHRISAAAWVITIVALWLYLRRLRAGSRMESAVRTDRI